MVRASLSPGATLRDDMAEASPRGVPSFQEHRRRPSPLPVKNGERLKRRFSPPHRSDVFPACQSRAAGRPWSFADPIKGRAPDEGERRMGQDVRSPRGPRCIALVGPFQSGKTTLLEAILARTGAIARAGSVDAGTSVGDGSSEARHHKMSVSLTAATTSFMGDSYTFIDCPGSVEFIHDMRAALPAVDAAVVVCEADEKKLPQLQIILRELEDLKIPRFLFLNKIDP